MLRGFQRFHGFFWTRALIFIIIFAQIKSNILYKNLGVFSTPKLKNIQLDASVIKQCINSEDPSAKWDGNFLGAKAEMGVYMYYLKYASGVANTERVQKGDVTLIR